MCRFSSDTFGKVYKQTIGVDFFMKRVELPGATTVLMQCWDIGGQTIGSKMLRSYIFGAHAVVLAYDITNAASFADLEDWLSECRSVFKDKMPLLALVGNKSALGQRGATAAVPHPPPPHPATTPLPSPTVLAADMGHMRTVKPQKHKDFADSNGMASYFVSAKTGDNVAAMFYRVAADLAGVTVSKPELQVAAKVIPATIIDHPQNDPAIHAPAVGARAGRRPCVIM